MEWIPVSDSLPAFGQKVLCFCASDRFSDNGPFFICDFYGEDQWHWSNDSYKYHCPPSLFSPTHWMPLPVAPGK